MNISPHWGMIFLALSLLLSGCAISPSRGIAIYETEIRPEKEAEKGAIISFAKRLECTISADTLNQEFAKDERWAMAWWLYCADKLPQFVNGFKKMEPVLEQLNDPPSFPD